MKQVEVLFFDGCPNLELASSRAREAIANTGASVDLHLVRVDGDADAIARRFVGSPTVRIDGKDVEGAANARTDFGLQCRVYSVDGRLEGAPPVAWIEAALRGDFVEGGESGSASCCSSTRTEPLDSKS